ncbi:hypothetical protein [Silvanigrella aquatica]|uniref:Uncharacterized protein n=1 Tax=Silvanigrella aquatica TaxID=1915309 RepID=A0A1L4D1B1_9BACT|nr:hypothetical protein [Silvanigrella aquatica]APJ03981.1 hypothetical protein AXG55_08700 [Silvanigrella aquatica]
MEQLDLDLTGVSAYADSSYVRDRELWRGFLSYALPVVMAFDAENLEQDIADSVVYSFEELTAKGGKRISQYENLRCISTMLAREIGVPPEFALASFFEGEVPTKLYKIKYKPVKRAVKSSHEDKMIGGWLADLAKVQDDKKFIKAVEKWKSWLSDKPLSKVG